MTLFKVIVKPENSEPISSLKFNTEEDADKHIAGIEENGDMMFARTTADLLIIIKMAQFMDEWVEVFRYPIFRT